MSFSPLGFRPQAYTAYRSGAATPPTSQSLSEENGPNVILIADNKVTDLGFTPRPTQKFKIDGRETIFLSIPETQQLFPVKIKHFVSTDQTSGTAFSLTDRDVKELKEHGSGGGHDISQTAYAKVIKDLYRKAQAGQLNITENPEGWQRVLQQEFDKLS
jgi:hypothetical protein